MIDWGGKTAAWCAGVTAGCSAFAVLIALSPQPWPGWRHDLYDGLIVVGSLSLIALLCTGPPALISAYGNSRSNRRLAQAKATPPAEFSSRTDSLNDGFHAGTLLAIEVRAHAELTDARVTLTAISGPSDASIMTTPAQLYWHPGHHESTTIVDGAFGLINVARVGPSPTSAVMDSASYGLPWSLQDGEWRVELQFTVMGYSAQLITAKFRVSPEEGIPSQSLEWLELSIL